MRRVFMVLTVAALVPAMMVSAGPAQANERNFGSSNNFVQFDDSLVGFGDIDDDDIDFDDIFGFGRRHHGIDFDDIDGNDGIFGFGDFSGIDQDSDSGDIRIGSNVS
jgi:hypothetical protein